MGAEVYSGTCSACGRPLVQVNYFGKDTWTYHPADSYDHRGGQCPVLIIIKGTELWVEPQFSLDVPASVFVLDTDQPDE